jgi:hypothetical protein
MSLDLQDQRLLIVPLDLNGFEQLGELAAGELAVDDPSENLGYMPRRSCHPRLQANVV